MSNANQLLMRAAVAVALVLAGLAARACIASRAFLRERGFPAGRPARRGVAVARAVCRRRRAGRLKLPRRTGCSTSYVPGFDGLRVPARFGMIEALMLAMLADTVPTRSAALDGPARVLASRAASSSSSRPRTCPSPSTAWRPSADSRRRRRASTGPPARPRSIAKWRGSPPAACCVELPFGQPDYDLRAMFYSTVHWHALVNGYSGVFPPHYGLLTSAFSEMPRHPDVSLDALRRAAPPTPSSTKARTSIPKGPTRLRCCATAGAVEILRDGSDVLLRLPR